MGTVSMERRASSSKVLYVISCIKTLSQIRHDRLNLI